jgi:hypothetical protein
MNSIPAERVHAEHIVFRQIWRGWKRVDTHD